MDDFNNGFMDAAKKCGDEDLMQQLDEIRSRKPVPYIYIPATADNQEQYTVVAMLIALAKPVAVVCGGCATLFVAAKCVLAFVAAAEIAISAWVAENVGAAVIIIVGCCAVGGFGVWRFVNTPQSAEKPGEQKTENHYHYYNNYQGPNSGQHKI